MIENLINFRGNLKLTELRPHLLQKYQVVVNLANMILKYLFYLWLNMVPNEGQLILIRLSVIIIYFFCVWTRFLFRLIFRLQSHNLIYN